MLLRKSALVAAALAVAATAFCAEAQDAGAAGASVAVQDAQDVRSGSFEAVAGREIDLDRLREALEGQPGRASMRLTLEECVYMALERNRDILITEFQPQMAEADVFGARGEFDPLLGANWTYLNAAQATPPEYERFGGVSAIEDFRTMSSGSVSGKLRTGTVYQVNFNLTRERSTWSDFDDQWTSNLTLTVAQPLLRGWRPGINAARIRIAKQSSDAADQQLRLTVMTAIGETIKAYWDLVGAVEAVRVSEEALASAERLLETATKRLEIGSGAAIEVLQAKAGVATRQSGLIAAHARVADAEDLLKQLLDLRDDELFSAKQIVPVDRPEVGGLDIGEIEKSDDALPQRFALALDSRPEVQLGLIDIETARIRLAQAKDAMMPELEMTGSLSQGGREPSSSVALHDIRERVDNAYTVGVRASVPVGNRMARGAEQRARLTLEQAEQRLEKTKQDLMLRVRIASRAVLTSRILVESNRQTRVLQEANVVAEEKRLRLGVTTSYRVLEIQGDLTEAQIQELQAQISYEKALVELRLAEGTLLPMLGVNFEPPKPGKPVSYLRSLTPAYVATAGDWAWEKLEARRQPNDTP